MAPTTSLKDKQVCRERRRQFHTYSLKSMEESIKAVKEGMPTREAARKFGIPRSSLQDRLNGRINKMGPCPYLSSEDESTLAHWLEALAKNGFPTKRCGLLNSAQQIVRAKKIKTPFKNDKPGQKWYEQFMKRHPHLTLRNPETLITKERSVITEEYIRKCFSELQQYMREIDAEDILKDPDRIFNGDEISFQMCSNCDKIIAPKGYKNIYDIKNSNDKETITVLLIFTASGKTLPPMIVFPHITPPENICANTSKKWMLVKSESGWMSSECFYEYVVNVVEPWIVEHKIKKPVILFVDRHKSHITLELSTFCSENGIILHALPPNTTHLLQPADVSVFKPLKTNWKDTVRKWQSQPCNINSVLTKLTFPSLLAEILVSPLLPSAIKNGFRICGLYPLDPDAINYSNCIQNRLENMYVLV